jgi:hypothetical protein
MGPAAAQAPSHAPVPPDGSYSVAARTLGLFGARDLLACYPTARCPRPASSRPPGLRLAMRAAFQRARCVRADIRSAAQGGAPRITYGEHRSEVIGEVSGGQDPRR